MKKTKKFLALILAVLMVMATVPVAFAAQAEEYPTIYVIGAHKNEIYNAKGELIYPLDIDLGSILKEALMPCLEKLATGMLTDDFSDYAEEFNSYMAPIYEELILDKDGNVSNGSYTRFYTSTENVQGKTENYDVWDARFWYDWRESPMKTANELKAHIDNVIAATGKSKVQLIGRCYGANVIGAYLEKYKDHAKQYVSDISYYSSSLLGIDFMSAIYSGEIFLDDKAITNFLDYYMENKKLIEDEDTAGLVSALAEILQQVKVLGLTGDALLNFVNMFKADLLPLILRNSYGGWLSYWAMVTPELYEKAREFVFGTDELKKEYAGFIAKADDFYYNVQVNAVDTMLELKEAGINFYIFAKYNFPEMPLYEGATAQGDSDTSVYRQSFGGTSADYNEVLSDEYLANVPAEKQKYISPDKKVDASTSLFPDTTWFIKDLHHDFFGPLQDMSVEIMRYDMTVESNKYPQFLTTVGSKPDGIDGLIPTEGVDEDNDRPEDNIFASLIRFLTSLINVLVKLFKDGFKK